MANSDIVCVSGGFDPLHPGHLALIESAAKYGPVAIILNSDAWLIEKKGYRVMNWEDRAAILRSIKWVTSVESVNDRDRTVAEALRRIQPKYFAKSGDRKPEAMPMAELQACRELGIELLFDICPHLPYSSSQIISQRRPNEGQVWKPWGSFEVLDERTYPEPPNWKVKRLDFACGQKTSLQRHENRSEHFIVVRGKVKIEVGKNRGAMTEIFGLQHAYINVPLGYWHRITNIDNLYPLTLIEVQMGRECSEVDIMRDGEEKPLVDAVDMTKLSANLQDA